MVESDHVGRGGEPQPRGGGTIVPRLMGEVRVRRPPRHLKHATFVPSRHPRTKTHARCQTPFWVQLTVNATRRVPHAGSRLELRDPGLAKARSSCSSPALYHQRGQFSPPCTLKQAWYHRPYLAMFCDARPFDVVRSLCCTCSTASSSA